MIEGAPPFGKWPYVRPCVPRLAEGHLAQLSTAVTLTDKVILSSEHHPVTGDGGCVPVHPRATLFKTRVYSPATRDYPMRVH